MITILLVDWENFKRKIGSVFKEVKQQRPQLHDYNFKGLFDKVLNGISIDRTVLIRNSEVLEFIKK